MPYEPPPVRAERPLEIAVIGAGISGLAAAWLLAQRHRVTLYEAAGRLGGHSNTVVAGGVPVDTGFIVYNEATYPNLTALFRHLGVPTKASDMSFAVSIDGGRLEYAGGSFAGLLAQPANLLRPRFWSMLAGTLRFYRQAPRDLARLGLISLDEYLAAEGYGAAFRDDHLYPMASAIWSTPASEAGRYPAAAFIRFCKNHGLLKFAGRPVWRTVEGGSRVYVERMAGALGGGIVTGRPVTAIRRIEGGVALSAGAANESRFDHVVVAAHADQALRMLTDPSPDERRLLGAFRYARNEAVLHADTCLMPRRRAAWSSWNYLGRRAAGGCSVTYWMNRLQGIPEATPLFVSLNPSVEPAPERVIRRETYEHPQFDAGAIAAQGALWSLQGRRNTWFCGAYFGAGFHEDGLQAGLAVAEALGGVRRPWSVPDESGRILILPPSPLERAS
jgi:hypothetical protein